MSNPDLERFACPSCKSDEALLTATRFGIKTFFCPACEHTWDEPVNRDGARPLARE